VKHVNSKVAFARIELGRREEAKKRTSVIFLRPILYTKIM
jgi:hypothetical protein